MPIVLFVKHTTDSFKSRPWHGTSWLPLPMAPPDWWLAPGANSANVFEQRLYLKVRVVPHGHVHVLPQTCTQDLGHVDNCVLVSDCASHVTRCAIQHYQSRDWRLLVTVSASCKDLEIRMRFISSRGLSSPVWIVCAARCNTHMEHQLRSGRYNVSCGVIFSSVGSLGPLVTLRTRNSCGKYC